VIVAPEQVEFDGPAGRLEGVLEVPEDGASRGVCVVCHPHPVHGGTMRNTIVYRTARALRAAGFATLRFNFRGVEGSAGEHDGGGGPGSEEDDAAAGLELLSARFPDVPRWAAGYSFGARTVCGLAARDARVERLVLVAFPVAVYDCAAIVDVRQPGFLLFGDQDEFGTAAALARCFPELPSRLEVHEIAGADHFFRGRTPLLEERVRDYARAAMEPTP
jgi:alpha/beta superfamily hydrolase